MRLMRGRGAKGQQFFVRTTSSASLTGRKEVKLARRSELMKNGHSYAINDLTNNWSNIVLKGKVFCQQCIGILHFNWSEDVPSLIIPIDWSYSIFKAFDHFP